MISGFGWRRFGLGLLMRARCGCFCIGGLSGSRSRGMCRGLCGDTCAKNAGRHSPILQNTTILAHEHFERHPLDAKIPHHSGRLVFMMSLAHTNTSAISLLYLYRTNLLDSLSFASNKYALDAIDLVRSADRCSTSVTLCLATINAFIVLTNQQFFTA
jgi:hypothetical protein